MNIKKHIQGFALYLFPVLLLLPLLHSCQGGGGGSYISASGKPGEIMLTMDKQYLDAPIGGKVQRMLTAPVIGLAQNEASMRVSRVPSEGFDGFLRYVRNILIVDIDESRFTTTSLQYSYDEWAKGQIVLRLNSVSADSLSAYLDRNSEAIMNYFVNHELYRFGQVLEKSYSGSADRNTDSIFKHHLNAPGDMVAWKYGQDFLWMSNNLPRKRHDMLVYSYPYTGAESLGIDRMTAMRDSVLQVNIQGSTPDSYPTTQKEFELYHRYVTLPDGTVRGELRGLWEMHGKDRMGGPFVQQAYHNKADNRVYVVEGFVYNPNEEQLTLLRMMEAMLYSFRPNTVEAFDPALVLKCKDSKFQ